MSPARIILVCLAVLLLATGGRTRPVEAAPERFERLKPPPAAPLTAGAA